MPPASPKLWQQVTGWTWDNGLEASGTMVAQQYRFGDPAIAERFINIHPFFFQYQQFNLAVRIAEVSGANKTFVPTLQVSYSGTTPSWNVVRSDNYASGLGFVVNPSPYVSGNPVITSGGTWRLGSAPNPATFDAGALHHTTVWTGASVTLNSEFIEPTWCLLNSGAAVGSRFMFRVADNGTAFDAYKVFAYADSVSGIAPNYLWGMWEHIRPPIMNSGTIGYITASGIRQCERFQMNHTGSIDQVAFEFAFGSSLDNNMYRAALYADSAGSIGAAIGSAWSLFTPEVNNGPTIARNFTLALTGGLIPVTSGTYYHFVVELFSGTAGISTINGIPNVASLPFRLVPGSKTVVAPAYRFAYMISGGTSIPNNYPVKTEAWGYHISGATGVTDFWDILKGNSAGITIPINSAMVKTTGSQYARIVVNPDTNIAFQQLMAFATFDSGTKTTIGSPFNITISGGTAVYETLDVTTSITPPDSNAIPRIVIAGFSATKLLASGNQYHITFNASGTSIDLAGSRFGILSINNSISGIIFSTFGGQLWGLSGTYGEASTDYGATWTGASSGCPLVAFIGVSGQAAVVGGVAYPFWGWPYSMP